MEKGQLFLVLPGIAVATFSGIQFQSYARRRKHPDDASQPVADESPSLAHEHSPFQLHNYRRRDHSRLLQQSF
jgi:hypothetical protein